MKKILICLLISIIAQQGSAQTTTAQLAARIAQKIRDSLALSDSQYHRIYTINMQIAAEKQAARAASTNTEQVRGELQQIENSRDSRYQPVLGEEKLLLYKRMKKNLISNS